MFVDASAIVGILLAESDMLELRAKLKASRRYTSPIAVYEATVAIFRVTSKSMLEAHAVVASFLKAFRIQVLPIEERHALVALETFERFGKNRHKAKLNMGDCFSYACARVQRVPLLYKGDDFVETDIKSA